MYGYNIERGLNTAANRVGDRFNSVRSQASEGFGLGGQVEERPWLMLGAALAAGFVLGSLLGGDDERSDSREDWAKQNRNSTRGNEQFQPFYNQYHEQQDVMGKAQQATYEYGGPSSYGSSSGNGGFGGYNSSLTSTSYSANTGASNPANFATSAPSQPKQPGPVATKVNEQVDSVVSMAGEVVRNFLRDTIRDAVPSMRDQVDVLDRRDGRTPASTSPTQRTGNARLYEVDDATTRTSDPSLT